MKKQLHHNFKKIVDGYLAYCETADEAYAWADKEFEKITSTAEGLTLVFEWIKLWQTENEISQIDASPLDDLIVSDSEGMQTKLSLMSSNSKMYKATEGIRVRAGDSSKNILDKMTNLLLINDYLTYIKTKDDIYFWAFIEIDNKTHYPEALTMVFELVQACQTDKEISRVAAGPLENIIKRNFDVIETELTVMVRKNEKMRKAIRGVWASEGSPARTVLDRILNQFGLIYSSF